MPDLEALKGHLEAALALLEDVEPVEPTQPPANGLDINTLLPLLLGDSDNKKAVLVMLLQQMQQ